MSDLTIFLIIGGICVGLGIAIYLIGRWRNVSQGFLMFLVVFATVTALLGLSLVKMKMITGDWGE